MFNYSNSIFLSIIIPVYNLQDYIPNTLNKIIGQSLQNIEIICINDGSTDNSLKILEEYKNKDKRIKIINQENQGPAVSRNNGINIACGEYVAFIDGDDYPEEDFYFEKLYNRAKESDADIVKAAYKNSLSREFGIYRNKKIKENKTNFCTEYCSAVFKRDFLIKNKLYFPNLIDMEDPVFAFKCALCAEKIEVVDNLFLQITKRNDSLTNRKLTKAQIEDKIKGLKEIIELANKSNIEPDSYGYVCASFYSNVYKYAQKFKNKKLFLNLYEAIKYKEEFEYYVNYFEPGLIDRLKSNNFNLLIKNIFSYIRYRKHDVLTIFGLKIKLRRPKTKNIGILNFYFENENYGAILTAYALNKLLTNMGFDALNINHVPSFYKKRNVVDNSNFVQFRNRYIPQTDFVSDKKQFKKLNKYFDTFIVGSDQVFRNGFTKRGNDFYYLNFVNNKNKKIAYSASFGVDKFEGKKIRILRVKKWLKRFDSISVREESGLEILKNTFNIKNAIHVLDPVFLVDWKEITQATKGRDKFYYILNKDINELIDCDNSLNSSIKIEEWLGYIKNSDLIVTDSFHCMCFCIIFEKKFVALAHSESPVARIISLFNMFELPKDKIINESKISDKNNNFIENVIDCKVISKEKMNLLIKNSKNFLSKALED